MSEVKQFAVNDRARVNALGNKYHKQVVRILSLNVKTPDGEAGARIRVAGGFERLITLDKLQPFAAFSPATTGEATPNVARPQYVPTLPDWAKKGMVMCQGRDLEAGQVIYFSAKANPRTLAYPVSATEWRGTGISTGGARFSTSVYITPNRWYVVGQGV